MSCGQPHEVDCTEVLGVVYTFLDNEADDATCAMVRQHLEECSPCLRKFGIERQLKELVARSCGCDPVPEDLRAKVVTRIREVRIEIERVERTVD
jgi:mycothiol system anti-sigma-R factor